MADVSIIIRAYNEDKALQRLLAHLQTQRFGGEAELIVVDNGSTDGTAAVASRGGATVVTLPQAEFSYPKSLNVGIERASAPVVVCLVAHAYPESNDWLARACRHFADEQVAGVFAYTTPQPDATVWDWLILWPGVAWGRWRGVRPVKVAGPGVFGATNIALRRALWEQHPFDEAYGFGGEDTAWAAWALSQEYQIIRDPAFTVRHSHYLRTFGQFWRQIAVWARTGKPREFDPAELAFREKR